MNKETFVGCTGLLESIFGVASPELIKFLWRKFKDIPDEKFKDACSTVADTFKPTSQTHFPLPAHFNEALGLTGNNRAILAVGAVKKAASSVGPYRSISFGDKAIQAAINHFGGWSVVSNWHDQEWQFNEKKFIDCYNANVSSGNGPNYLSGLAEDDYDLKCMALPPERRGVFLKQIAPVEYKWNGFTQLQLPNKTEEVKQIESEDMASIQDIMGSIF
jgi:hypothetical protein